jgi:NAD-dependent deacetylase sirtuin 4
LTEAELEVNVERVAEWLQQHSSHGAHGGRGILCLTGAGLSTESGIPDYRGANGSYHKGHKPMLHDQFMGSELMRKRYWARALMGWRSFANRQPNRGHYALSKLEDMGVVGVHGFDCSETEGNLYEDLFVQPSRKTLTTITQNVDGLQQKSSMSHVVDLHGAVSRLKCMSCGHRTNRDDFHTQLEENNADWLWEQEQLQKQHMYIQGATITKDSQLRPDGDAQLIKDDYDNLVVPSCPKCGSGFFKPDVVFFGDSVPLPRVRMCYNAVEASSAILCIGTSLAVHSAFRFVTEAAKQGKPIGILNVGPTRAEAHNLKKVTKIDSPIGSTLEAVVQALS